MKTQKYQIDEIYVLRQECRDIINKIWDTSKHVERIRAKVWVNAHINRQLETAEKVRVLFLKKLLLEKQKGEHCSLHEIDNVETRRRKRLGGNKQWKKVKAAFLATEPPRCKKCHKEPLLGEDLTVDHIQPLALQGMNLFENLQILCLKCHNKKSKGAEREFIKRKHHKENKPFIEQKIKEFEQSLRK